MLTCALRMCRPTLALGAEPTQVHSKSSLTIRSIGDVFIVNRKETVRPSTIVVERSDAVPRSWDSETKSIDSAVASAKVVDRFSW